jgi:hypothetical protein
MDPNQIKPSSFRASSIREASSVQEESWDTIPPTAAAATLIQVEKVVALNTGKATSVPETWNEDLVITSQDQPELLSKLAQALGVEPKQVTLHLMVSHGMVHRAVFINEKLERGRRVSDVLNRINWS